jgi:ParB family transcriptional regulator, chromosome partitioning protein
MKKPQLQYLPLDALQPGRYQPRRHFDDELLNELAKSIATAGLLQPVVVRPLTDNRYEIIAGERRWRAARLAGLTEIPCLVSAISDAKAIAATTIENIQREDLNAIEEARSYQRLIEEFHYQHDEVAAIIGKSRVYITNMLRLLNLLPEVQQMLIDKQLTNGHGKVLASMSGQEQLRLAQMVIDDAWSVRQLEQYAKKPAKSNKAIRHAHDPDREHLESKIAEQVGTAVSLEESGGAASGWLKIRYFDHETLAGVLDKLGVQYE